MKRTGSVMNVNFLRPCLRGARLLAGVGVFVAGLGLTTGAQAGTFTVTNSNSSGVGSLSAAISSADASPGSTIAFSLPTNSTITLTSALPAITAGTVVDGSGSSGLTISGGGTQRIFFVQPGTSGTVTVENLTLANGAAQGGAGGAGGGGGGMGAGGAIFVGAGSNVTIANVSFANNQALGGSGGGSAPGEGGGGGGLGGNGGASSASGGGGGGGGGGVFAGQNGGAGVNTVGGGAGGGPGGGSGGAYSNSANGGAGGDGAASGGGGGGGGGSDSGLTNAGNAGAGGFGSGGGGGGTASFINGNGGNGGFGGGGGSGGEPGSGGSAGNGGFGGGGASSACGAGVGGVGGVGGGAGAAAGCHFTHGGGGGGAFGGAVFVQGADSALGLGAGALTVSGSTSTAFSGSGVTAGAGTLGGTNGAAAGSDLFLQSGTTTTLAPGSGATLTFNGTIADDSPASLPTGQSYTAGTGAGAAITVNGAGTVALDAANTYSGGTVLSAGTLVVGNNSALGTGALAMSAGTTLSFVAGNNYTIANNITIAGDPTFNPPSGTVQTINGVISDGGTPGVVDMIGPGTLILTAANTYSGGTTLSGGVLQAGDNSALGTGTLSFDGGTLQAGLSSLTLANAATVDANGGTIDANGDFLLYTGNIADGTTRGGTLTIESSTTGGAVVLSGDNTYSGATLVSSGVVLSAGSTTGFSPNSAFTVNGDLILAGHSNTIQSLAGSGFVSNNNAAGATLTLDAASGSTTFSGVIQDGAGGGALSLTKSGGATQILTGANTYTGATTVAAGSLVVNGSIDASNATIDSGATLGGSGTVGGLSALSGATVAPGVLAPYSTLSVLNGVGFAAGSTYAVDVNAAGASDLIAAGGAAVLAGGTVVVNAAPGAYAAQTLYTILTAQGGVAGQFAGVSDNQAFLTPSLLYPADAVELELTRNAVSFASVAATQNQRATGAAVQALGPGDALYQAVVNLSAAQAQAAFDAASGEAHASAVSAAFEDSRLPREAVLDRLASPYGSLSGAGVGAAGAVERTQGLTAWGRGFGAFGRLGSDGNAAGVTRSLGGFVAGLDTRVAPQARIGVAAGYTQSTLSIAARASSGTIESAFGGLYGGAGFGPLRLSAGAIAAAESFGIERSVAFPGFGDTERSSYGGRTLQAFGEAGWRLAFGRVKVEPFARAVALRVDANAFSESGGAAALVGLAGANTFKTTTLGARYSYAPFAGLPLRAHGVIGWRHAYGALAPTVLLAFASAPGAPFAIAGAPIARDALVTETGLDWRVSEQASLGLFYSGERARNAHDDALEAKFQMRF